MKARRIQILSGLLFILFLFGCSIQGTYYLRNFTDQTAKVILMLTEPATKTFEAPTFAYSNKIEKLKRDAYKKFSSSLKGKYLTDSTIEVLMSAESTLFFAFGTNSRVRGIKTLQIESKNGIEILHADDINKLDHRMRGGGQYTAHKDIQ
ncbi:MAG: hypothetical protein AAF363_08450 [Bacteroidota bacterium]